MGRTGRRGLGDERDESLTDGDGVGWDGVGRRRHGLGWHGPTMAWAGMAWVGDGMGWDGVGWRQRGLGWDGVGRRQRGLGRRRRGLGDEKDESLRDERDDESLRVMMRVHGEIEIEIE